MSDSIERFWVVIPAGGMGSRMASEVPKQYLEINRITIIEHTINVFLDNQDIHQIIVCLPENDERFSAIPVSGNSKVATTRGGDSRAQSVLNGLTSIDADTSDWVLVHDAARPCLTSDLLASLINQLRCDDIGGLLAVPAKDTLKLSNQDQSVDSTIDRSTIWQAQTPQMFRYGILKNALGNALEQGLDITDESSSLEHAGYKPKLIEGDSRNLKVTTPDDLVLAKFLLDQLNS